MRRAVQQRDGADELDDVGDAPPSSAAEAFEDYLPAMQVRHIYCAPHHPQTDGKLERVHEMLKARRNSPTTGGPTTPDAGPAGSLQSGLRRQGTRDELPGELSGPRTLAESQEC